MPRPDALQHRHEFVLFFDVKNGNPNGDPDAGNMPRIDPETGHGLVSDVCLKRKIRNYVELAKADAPRFRIYVTEGAILNERHREAYVREYPGDEKVAKAKELSPKSDEQAARIRNFMCDNFFDIRTFGAVLSTKINAGQVRGPVQIAFATSVEPVLPLEVSITRMAATNEAEKKEREQGDDSAGEKRGDNRTMGRKFIVPYGLYRAPGFISAPLAHDARKGTGFTDEDLDLLLQALCDMFEHDHSAARGEMTTRKLIVFKHASALGSARADDLFKRVKVWRRKRGDGDGMSGVAPSEPSEGGGDLRKPASKSIEDWPAARSYEDYAITIDRESLPSGIELIERC